MRTSITPLFKWAGSKQRMLTQYEPHIVPPEAPQRFVDLFAGGLTMTLWAAERYPHADLIINDNNVELIHLYRQLAADVEGVIVIWERIVAAWLVRDIEKRKAYYYDLRTIYVGQETNGASDNMIAALLLFMLQVNFNGLWKAYKKCNYLYSTAPGTCKQTAESFDAHRIRVVAYILKHRATIYCDHFQDVPFGPYDFVYADPPYRSSVVEYQGGFTDDDQRKLAKHLMRHGGGPWAYSNKLVSPTDDFYTQHFPGMHIHPMSATYTAGVGTATHYVSEVLVTNFKSRASHPQLV